MGLSSSNQKKVCMKNHKIWDSVVDNIYEITSDHVYILHELKTQKKHMTVIHYNFPKKYKSGDITLISHRIKKGFKFRIEHIDLIHDSKNDYYPHVKATVYKSLQSDIYIGDKFEINYI